MSDNREQIEFWNGRTGERWVTEQERLDRVLGPLGEAGLDCAAVRPGERVVDVGCGCGATSRGEQAKQGLRTSEGSS